MTDATGMPAKTGFATIAYCLAGLGFLAMFFAGSRLLTVEADESWMLMSTMKAFGLSVTASSALDHPVVTSGGLHLLIHGLLASLNSVIELHRGVSLIFAAACMALVFALVLRHTNNKTLAAAAVAAFATTPGFLLQASLATAELIATATFLVAAWYWVQQGSMSMRHAAASGVLFGLACATRMTCLAMLPALVLWSMLVHKSWTSRLVYPLAATLVSLLVFTVCVQAYTHAFSQSGWNLFAPQLSGATGVGTRFKGVMGVLNYLLIGDGTIPALGILVLLGLYVGALRSWGDDPLVRIGSFLLIAGLTGLIAWMVKSPIAHIRYLWPAASLIWLSGILIALLHLARGDSPIRPWTFHFVVVGLCAIHALLNLRALAIGESLTLQYEFNRTARVEVPLANFKARADQDAIVRAVMQLPSSARVYVINATAAYPVVYAGGRTVQLLSSGQRVGDEDYLLMLPINRYVWPPSSTQITWIDGHSTPVAQHGDHVLRRLQSGLVAP